MNQLFRALFVWVGLVTVLLLLGWSSSQVILEAGEPTPVATPAVFPEVDQLNAFVCDVSSENPVPVCHAYIAADAHPAEVLEAQQDEPCEEGLAADFFPCENVALQAFVPLIQLEGGAANDIWGWTDPESGREYALIGLDNGTAFVDVTDPTAPQVLGRLPTHAFGSLWRDVKVYQNHAYIVADLAGAHGLQVFDLTQLRGVTTFTTFTETTHYDHFNEAHNLIINEESGFAYAVGIQSGVTCEGGLHMINIQEPANPLFAGCYEADGYTHDAQCVIYQGPDDEYTGRELCFNANTNAITIVDVSDKSDPTKLAESTYSGAAYTHQLWLTADQQYMLVNDEMDELSGLTPNGRSQTYIWDVRDIDEPQHIGTYTAVEVSIDHNLYIHEGYVYQANYRTGLRVLDAENMAAGRLVEVAHFDTYPNGDGVQFNGAWSVYPFFESGTLIVSSIEQGLFALTLEFPFEGVYYLPSVIYGADE